MATEKEQKIEPRGQDYYNQLADKLDGLQKVKNNGRGVTCMRDIISCLRHGDVRSAKAIVSHDHDKINDALGVYSDIKQTLIDELFDDDEDHPWSFSERFNKRLDK